MINLRATGADTVLAVMLRAARKAARTIQQVYSTSNFDVEMKGPNDPVTRADKEANAIIIAELREEFPDVPIVAEESDPKTYANFREADAAFFVDPLDGTREFVAKNGEFCVMIGLAVQGRAQLGVVVRPTDMRAFLGGIGSVGSWEIDKMGERTHLRMSRKRDLKDVLCIISRSHRSAETDAILKKMHCKELIPYGSAGLKALKVAMGEVDLYCHPGPSGCRWDSCAVEAIITGAGGVMTDANGKHFDYRGKSLKNSSGVLCGNAELHEKALVALHRAPTKKSKTKKSSAKKSSAPKAAPKKSVVKKAAPKKASPKKSVAKNSKKPAPKKGASRRGRP